MIINSSPASGHAPGGLLCLIALLLAAGCGSQKPTAGLPPVPEDRTESVEVAVDFPAISHLSRNTVQVPYSNIAPRSTVLITHGNLGGDSKGDGDLPVNDREALALAREEMEKELMRRGFRIIDHQQVEAKLGELALDKPCSDTRQWWHCTTHLNNKEVAYLDGLKARADKGEIAPEEFAGRMERSRGIWQNRVTGLNALLNAVAAKRIQADYVLEISAFEPAQRVSHILDLNDIAEVRRFLGDYPEVESQLADKRYLKCEGVGARVKARLIDTRNSEVVWLGGHTVSEVSRPDSQYLMELAVRRRVANRDEVLRYLEESGGRESGRQPEWRFSSELVGPRLLRGSCGVGPRQPEVLQRTSNALAGRAARELVATIKVQGGEIIRSGPPALDNSGGAVDGDASDKSRFLRESVGPLQIN